MSLAQGNNTQTRPRIEPGSPDPESDALTTRPVRPPPPYCDCTAQFVSNLVGHPEDRFSHNEAHIICTFEQCHWKNCLFANAKNKGADQLCGECKANQHLCFRYIDSTILPKSKILSQPVFVAVYCIAWFGYDLAGNTKTGFLMLGLTLKFAHSTLIQRKGMTNNEDPDQTAPWNEKQ